MIRILSISVILLYTCLSMGAMASSIWTEEQADQFIVQKGSIPDDRGGQESQEIKDLSNEYCSRSTLTISELDLVKVSLEHYIDRTGPWIIQTISEIQTPPPDHC